MSGPENQLKSKTRLLRGRIVILLLLACGAAAATVPLPPGDDLGTPTVETITADELRSMVFFLASDALAGREAGTGTNEVAVRYLAHQFEMLGLEPAGLDGTYLQPFQLTRSRVSGTNRFLLTASDSEEEGRLVDDFFPLPVSASGVSEGSLLFVGYGLSVPELGWDDYRGLDASGRIVVALNGEPAFEEPEDAVRTQFLAEASRDIAKARYAEDAGASGLILVPTGRRSGMQFLRRVYWPSDEAGQNWSALNLAREAVGIPVVLASSEFLAEAFGKGRQMQDLVQAARQGRERFPEIEGRARLETRLDVRELESWNVLGLLPGDDHRLDQETVLVTAHLDHVGVSNGRVFNGADDNASGTSAVLEVAEAFLLSPVRPRRSVLFALWNAEEHGLLGSRYFVEDPTVSVGLIRAVFQMDMIGRSQEIPESEDPRFRGLDAETAAQNLDTVHLVGHSWSQDLASVIERAARQTGLTLRYDFDAHPLNLVRRSDSWPFLLRGIPAALLSTGLHPDYHTPDDTADKLDYSKMERIARMVYLAAWEAANSDHPIRVRRAEETVQ